MLRCQQGSVLKWVLVIVQFATGAARLTSVGTASWLRSPFSRDYSYSRHGQEWQLGSCATGQQQSPIDFPWLLAAAPAGTFAHDYRPGHSSVRLSNNGHAYVIDLFGQGYGGIVYAGSWYNLLSVTVHASSEHTWAGLHKPAELHLVHKKHDDGAMLVVAIPFDCANRPGVAPLPTEADCAKPSSAAPGFSSAVQVFLDTPPFAHQDSVVQLASSWDVNALLDGGRFFAYMGSMTVPPCAEVVTWLVRTEPLAMSDIQAGCLQIMIFNLTGSFGNNRATMPLNGRTISMLTAVRQNAQAEATVG